MEKISGLYFMITTSIAMLCFVVVYLVRKRFYHLLYVVLFFCTTVWGLTVQNRDIEIIKHINGIAAPLIGGTCAMIGALTLMIEVLKSIKK